MKKLVEDLIITEDFFFLSMNCLHISATILKREGMCRVHPPFKFILDCISSCISNLVLVLEFYQPLVPLSVCVCGGTYAKHLVNNLLHNLFFMFIGAEIINFSYSQGQFLSPLRTQSPGLNVVCRRLVVNLIGIVNKSSMCDIFACKPLLNQDWGGFIFNFSKLHGLVACGGDDGAVECFDMRTKSSIGRINAVEHGGDINEVTLSLYSCIWNRFLLIWILFVRWKEDFLAIVMNTYL